MYDADTNSWGVPKRHCPFSHASKRDCSVPSHRGKNPGGQGRSSCSSSSSAITAARILPTVLAFLTRRGLWRAVSRTSVSRALVSTGLDALWSAGHVSGHRDRRSEPRSQSTSGLCSRSQSRPMITSSSPMSVTTNTTFSRWSPIAMSNTATSLIVPSRFSVPSMLYRGIGRANFLVAT